MTSYGEVREMIEASSYVDWINFSNIGVWTNQEDVALRIEQYEKLGQAQQPWTGNFQARSIQYGYVVYYDSSPVEYHTVVGVDNDRAFVPQPQPPQAPGAAPTITPYQQSIGEIITGDPGTFESYLNRAGIAVQG